MAISPALSEVEGGPVSYPKTVFSMLAETLRKSSQNTAVISMHQQPEYLSELTGRGNATSLNTNGSSGDCLSWTFQELHNASLRLVTGLRAQGIGPGSTMVTIMPNGIEWLLLYWSSYVGKFAICALDFGVVSTPRAAELVDLLSVSSADAVFVADAEGAAAVDIALLSVQKKVSCKGVIAASTGSPADWKTLTAYCPDVPNAIKEQIEQEAEEDDLQRAALIVFTSGTTTGHPKGCARTVASMLHSVVCQSFGHDYGASTRHLLQTQNFRIIAATLSLATWAMGGGVVMPGAGFLPPVVLEAISRHKITSMVLVPAMIHILTALPEFQTTERSSVKTVLVGADIITRDLYEKIANAFPSADVVVGHGMTEGGGVVSRPFRTEIERKQENLVWYSNIASLGKVNLGTKIRIVDEECRPVPRGDNGELHVCNISFVRHYIGGLQPEDFHVDKSGSWFKTGDIARLDEEGNLFLLGRRKDIVKRAGVSIMPAGLECCIDEFLKSQSSVIAVNHPVLGQVPFAVVASLNGKSKQEVEQKIIDYFGKDSSLGGVATLADLGLEKFPLNKTEKIVKRELDGPVATYLAANGGLS